MVVAGGLAVMAFWPLGSNFVFYKGNNDMKMQQNGVIDITRILQRNKMSTGIGLENIYAAGK